MTPTFWVVVLLLVAVAVQCWGVAVLARANRRQSESVAKLADATGTFVEAVERLLIRQDTTAPEDPPG